MNRHIETYLRHVGAIEAATDAQAAPFYFNNPLFVLSRLAISPDFTIDVLEGGVFFDAAGEWAVLLPTTSERTRYLASVRVALRRTPELLRLPEWSIPALDGFEVGAHWPDWIGSTAELQTMAGRKYKSVRRGIERAQRSGRTQVVRLTPEHAAAAAAIARDWYRARAPVLGTMWLEQENVWLFEHLDWLEANLPGFVAMGVKVDGELQAVNLSCRLSATMWCCHTERYRPGVLTYCNQLAYREACRVFDALEHPWVNDGCSEADPKPGINDFAAFKARLAVRTLVPHWARAPR